MCPPITTPVHSTSCSLDQCSAARHLSSRYVLLLLFLSHEHRAPIPADASPAHRAQGARSYATSGASAGSGSRTSAGIAGAAAAAAAGLGGYQLYLLQRGGGAAHTEALDSASSANKKAFTGGDQGFLSLKLDSVETVNHNVKKFRFALPESDMESGLSVACA